MKIEVGCVTEEERDEILAIFERRNGLNELAKILTANNSELYERLVKDISDTTAKFQKWWNDMVLQYKWEGADNGHWEIDFNSCKIYLVTKE